MQKLRVRRVLEDDCARYEVNVDVGLLDHVQRG